MDNTILKIKEWLGTGSINFFGLPFAGKDTQGKLFADYFGGIMISSGDVLRHDHGNQKVHDIMAAGGIIPSELFEEILLPYLERPELAGKPLILSEVGRVKGEEQIIMRATENSGHPTKAVILLSMPDEEVWRRFEASQKDHDRGQRDDDNRNVLRTRLEKYHGKVTPVIDYYRSIGLLIEVDGSQDKDQVTQEIIEKLTELSSR